VYTLDVVPSVAGLEQDLSGTEALIANQDFAAIRQLVVLLAST